MAEPSTASSTASALRLKASGNELLAAGDYSGAVATYTEALELLPPTAGASNNHESAEPPLRCVLLSNRSHAYLSSGCVDKALEDAMSCATLQPAWPKAHVRRAKALQQKGPRYRRDALDAYDDALKAAERMVDVAENKDKTAAFIKDIKAARKKCARELRETGSSELSKPVADFGCLLAVPEGATISECRCLTATLDPATYDAVDDRTNTPIHADFPGDSGWPMFVPTIIYKATQKAHPFPLCYYIIGPCTLTKACANEIDSIFRPMPQQACRWPDGKATRTCPFCAGACIPGRGETFTMVVHLLIGKSNGNIGNKLMMQLVCERCTRKRLLKVGANESEENVQQFFDNGNSNSGLDPLPRLRKLTESSHAIKTAMLWNRASNTGLISSITLHAMNRIRGLLSAGGVQVMGSIHNTGARNTRAEGRGEGEFFDNWMSQLDDRAIYKPQNDADRVLGITGGGGGSVTMHWEQIPPADRGRFMGSQEFNIVQVARIKDLQKALGRFWQKHGSDFRLHWSTWDAEERQSLAYDTGRAFFESKLEHYNRRHTQYHHVEDPRPLMNKPFGNVPKDTLSFLPEVAGSVSGACDLLQMFRDRIAVGKTWVDEDVALVAKLKKQGALPKLQYKEKDGSYLCDYMGLRDPLTGPFIVLVGEREAEYNATGALSSEMSPEEAVKLSEYRSLREPFAENITILNAVADGRSRSMLNNLLHNGAATCAVCYIYAVMRQTLLLEYLQAAASYYCVKVGKDDPKEMERWTYQGTSSCYVCAARAKPDGSALFVCTKCRNINYCSPECQKIDWKRHKAESCVTSPNFVGNDGRPKPGTSQNRKRKGGKGKKKNRK